MRPGSRKVCYHLGLTYLLQNKTLESSLLFEQIIQKEISPEEKDAYSIYIYAYFLDSLSQSESDFEAMNRYIQDQVMELYERAYRLNPRLGLVYLALARSYTKNGLREPGLKFYRKFIKFYPGYRAILGNEVEEAEKAHAVPENL